MNAHVTKSILIADDEPLARDRIRQLMEDMDGFSVVAEAENGEQVIQQCSKFHPDILLLDIRMPGLTGLEVASQLATWHKPPAVIFTTAHDEFALPAFDAHAIDYIMKPVRRDRLQQALNKAQKITAKEEEEQAAESRKHICAQMQGNVKLIPIDDVVYFMAEHKYITVRHLNGEVLIEDSLKNLHQEFGDRFIRVHRNALVARAYLMSLEKDLMGPYRVKLRGVEDKVEVSRRHVANVRDQMKQM